MNPVARFESFIERLMERMFTRAARSHLQPVEIGKRLIRAMEGHQSVGMDGVLVPNVYDVFLSSADYAHFEPMRRSLARNMESHLARAARLRHFQLVSQPVVRLHDDRRLPTGEVRVEPHLQDVEVPEQPEIYHTALLPAQEAASVEGPSSPSHPTLALNGQTFAVLRSPTTLGRLPDNDIVVNDKRVSRRHAEVIQQGPRWVLRDVGSTNGTAVNGKIVKEIALKPGDTISLGGLDATWEQ